MDCAQYKLHSRRLHSQLLLGSLLGDHITFANMEDRESKKPKKAEDVAVSFLGGMYSFSHNAACSFFDTTSNQAALKSAPTIRSLFQLVADNEVDFALVPAESATTGSIAGVIDDLLLFSSKGIEIMAEKRVLEKNALSAWPGVSEQDIGRVFGHPNLIEGCKDYLVLLDKRRKSLGLPSIERIMCSDSTTAVNKVAEEGAQHGHDAAAAISSEAAAVESGLHVLMPHVGSTLYGETRYIVIGKATKTGMHEKLRAFQPSTPFRGRRATLVLCCGNEPGALMRWSSCFAMRNINILRLETRPAVTTAMQQKPGGINARHFDMLFVVDYAVPDAVADAALITNLQEYCVFFRQLGVYDIDGSASVEGTLNESILDALVY